MQRVDQPALRHGAVRRQDGLREHLPAVCAVGRAGHAGAAQHVLLAARAPALQVPQLEHLQQAVEGVGLVVRRLAGVGVVASTGGVSFGAGGAAQSSNVLIMLNAARSR
nr:hypothetical protein GCM10025730_17030 [Promicromonospora thailandica]